MSTNEKNFFQQLKELRLSERARTMLRSELLSYVELHTMPVAEAKPFNSFVFLAQIFSHSRALTAGALSLVLVVAGGSTAAFAAEKALPGDVLYPVKVLVAEPVAGVFAGGGVAKARFHASLAVRRVEEAVALEDKGALTAEKSIEIVQRFEKESDSAEAEATRLESSGDFSASLSVRSELASELALRIPENTARTEEPRTGKMATAAVMKVSVAPLTNPQSEKTEIEQVVAVRVARLRQVRPVPESATTSVVADERSSASEQIKTGPRQTALRVLLSGTSVKEDGIDESTTTASTTATGESHLLRTFLKEGVHKPENSTQQATDDLLHTDRTLEPIDHPERLVPGFK